MLSVKRLLSAVIRLFAGFSTAIMIMAVIADANPGYELFSAVFLGLCAGIMALIMAALTYGKLPELKKLTFVYIAIGAVVGTPCEKYIHFLRPSDLTDDTISLVVIGVLLMIATIIFGTVLFQRQPQKVANDQRLL